MIAAEGQHGKRIAADLADLVGDGGGGDFEPMIEPRKTPWFQSKLSWTSGMVVLRRPPTRIAEIGTPAGSSHSGAITGHCLAGAVKRAFG